MRTWLLVSMLAATAALAAAPGQQAAPPAAPRGIALERLTWPEAEEKLRPDTVVVLPIGAGSKEHGPHLELRNDLTMAEYLTRRILDGADVVAAPALTYHFYPAFVEYPGSTSLTLDTARTMTVEVVRGLARFGPRRFYALNTGISTLRPLEAAAKLLAAEGILLEYTNLTVRLEPAASRIRQQEGGTHADEIETSMMLYIDPTRVDMSRAVKDYTPSTGGSRLTRTRGAAGTYSPTGSWGDPTLATREKGALLVEALVSGILADIEAVRRAALPVVRPGASAAPAPSTAPVQPAAARAGRTCSPGDERDIRQIGDAYALHWTNADALELGRLWSREGDMLHPDGMIERTPQVIIANRTEMFRRPEYRGSKHSLTLTMIRCIGPDAAVADGKWDLRRTNDAEGNALPPMLGQATLVVTRSDQGWRISAYRYTITPPAAPGPTFLKRPGWPGRGGGSPASHPGRTP